MKAPKELYEQRLVMARKWIQEPDTQKLIDRHSELEKQHADIDLELGLIAIIIKGRMTGYNMSIEEFDKHAKEVWDSK